MKHYPLVRGIPNLVKAAHAPRHTAKARTRHPHLPESVEANIEQAQPPLALTKFQKCVKFRVHFSKQVAVLYSHGVGLQVVGANGFNPPLIEYHRNVLLGTGNLQAQRIRKTQQAVNEFCVHKTTCGVFHPQAAEGCRITSWTECRLCTRQGCCQCGQCSPTWSRSSCPFRAEIQPCHHSGGGRCSRSPSNGIHSPY